ncbi:MAG: hypothetical protein AAF443_00630 [Chlamydiota bacterium]
MNLNDIEKVIINEFFMRKGFYIKDKDCFFSDIHVISRNFSGVGFITDLKESLKLKVGKNNESYKWGHLGAKINSNIDTGYLLYLENGYIKTIEGYTYSEEWPENIVQIEVYQT